jgi:hypothetical protein
MMTGINSKRRQLFTDLLCPQATAGTAAHTLLTWITNILAVAHELLRVLQHVLADHIGLHAPCFYFSPMYNRQTDREQGRSCC